MASAAPEPLTGTKVLVMLVVFFGVVIGVNVTMATLAKKTFPGTEVDSPYAAGLSYNKEIAAAQEQAARKWQVDAHIERSADGSATLQVEARDAGGQPITGLKFETGLEWPADSRDDRSFDLTEVGIGIYRGNAYAVARGNWALVIKAYENGERKFLSRNHVTLN